MKKNICLIIAFVLLLALCAGCASNQTQNEPDVPAAAVSDGGDDKILLGGSIPEMTDDFNKIIFLAFEKKIATMDNVEYTMLDAMGDNSKQIADVDMLITKGVDAIIMIPFAADAMVPAVEAANAAGVPMIEINRRTTGGDYTYVGCSDVDAGRMQGEYLAEVLPENAKVCYIIGPLGGNATIERRQGLQYPQIDCIISQNDESAMGALEAVKTANKLGQTMVVGVDGTDEAVQSIIDGELTMTVFQNAVAMANNSVDVACKILAGEWEQGAHYLIPFEPVTKDNAEEYLGRNRQQ